MRLHITKYFITITGWLIALPLSRREASRAAAEIIFNEENASAGERRESLLHQHSQSDISVSSSVISLTI